MLYSFSSQTETFIKESVFNFRPGEAIEILSLDSIQCFPYYCHRNIFLRMFI